MHAPWKEICLILALVLFAISAWSAEWAAPQGYWHGRFIAAGLFFYVLSFLISQMLKSELIALAKATAVKYSLTPSIVCGLIEQESSWDRLAIRLEEKFYVEYIRSMVESGEITPSEGVLRSTSIGFGQTLLETDRELRYTGSFDELAADEQGQIDYTCKKLAACVAKNAGDLSAALNCYNGGGDPSYASKVVLKSGNY